MPSIGVTATWGQETWAAYVLKHLSAESVLLASGARRIDIQGKEAHVPRLLDDGGVAWVAELADVGELRRVDVAVLVLGEDQYVDHADRSGVDQREQLCGHFAGEVARSRRELDDEVVDGPEVI